MGKEVSFLHDNARPHFLANNSAATEQIELQHSTLTGLFIHSSRLPFIQAARQFPASDGRWEPSNNTKRF